MINKRHISIIGGAGHVGFPLGLILSSKNFYVNLIDKDELNLKKNKFRLKSIYRRRGSKTT